MPSPAAKPVGEGRSAKRRAPRKREGEGQYFSFKVLVGNASIGGPAQAFFRFSATKSQLIRLSMKAWTKSGRRFW